VAAGLLCCCCVTHGARGRHARVRGRSALLTAAAAPNGRPAAPAAGRVANLRQGRGEGRAGRVASLGHGRCSATVQFCPDRSRCRFVASTRLWPAGHAPSKLAHLQLCSERRCAAQGARNRIQHYTSAVGELPSCWQAIPRSHTPHLLDQTLPNARCALHLGPAPALAENWRESAWHVP
jgi:hypothetical protein